MLLKRSIQKILSAFGYRLVPLSTVPDCSLERFFPLIKNFGFRPRNVWDVGANHGNWTRAAVSFFPDAEYTLIEPHDLRQSPSRSSTLAQWVLLPSADDRLESVRPGIPSP